jgi:hypothetical protein
MTQHYYHHQLYGSIQTEWNGVGCCAGRRENVGILLVVSEKQHVALSSYTYIVMSSSKLMTFVDNTICVWENFHTSF